MSSAHLPYPEDNGELPFESELDYWEELLLDEPKIVEKRLPLTSTTSTYLNRIAVEISNRKHKTEVKSKKIKILILPEDLRSTNAHFCQAINDPSAGMNVCQKCDGNCIINRLTSYGEKNNLSVYLLTYSTLAQRRKIMSLLKEKFADFAVISITSARKNAQSKDVTVKMEIPAQCVTLDVHAGKPPADYFEDIVTQLEDILRKD